MLGTDWLKKKGKESAEYGKKVIGAEQIKESTSNLSYLAKKFLNPKEKFSGKTESFVEAKRRLNLTDVDLIKNYKNMSYCFYISFAFATICFLGCVYNLFILKQIMGALSMIAVLLICLANSFRFSFRAFQIKHQKLCSVKEWWDRPNEWFPKF